MHLLQVLQFLEISLNLTHGGGARLAINTHWNNFAWIESREKDNKADRQGIQLRLVKSVFL